MLDNFQCANYPPNYQPRAENRSPSFYKINIFSDTVEYESLPTGAAPNNISLGTCHTTRWLYPLFCLTLFN